MPAPIAAAAVGQAVAIVGRVVDALAAIPGKVRQFVDALNPSAVKAMDSAFRSLEATVGYALEPIIRTFTSVFRLLSSELNAPFTALREIVQDVAQTGFGMLRPIVRLLAVQMETTMGIFRALRPVLQPIIDLFQGGLTLWATVFQIVGQLTAAFVEWQAALVGDLVKLITGATDLQAAFAQLAFGVIKVTDFLLRLVGLQGLADSIKNSFTRTPGAGRPEGFREQKVTNIEDVYRQRLLEAAKAQGGAPAGPKRGAPEILADLLKEWQKTEVGRKRQLDVLQRIETLLSQPLTVTLAEKIKEVRDKFTPAGGARAAGEAMFGPFGILGDWL